MQLFSYSVFEWWDKDIEETHVDIQIQINWTSNIPQLVFTYKYILIFLTLKHCCAEQSTL